MSIAIAIDTGNYQIKTRNFEFPAYYLTYAERPDWPEEEVFEIDGTYYALQDEVGGYLRDKTENDRYLNLALMAIAKECHYKNKDEDPEKSEKTLRDVIMLAGLPPMHLQEVGMQKAYIEYFKNGGKITCVKYMGRTYNIKISDVVVRSQCLAALVTYAHKLDLDNRTCIIDIGGYTVDVVPLEPSRNGGFKINKSNVYSIEAGTNKLVSEVIRAFTGRKSRIDAIAVEKVLEGKKTYLPEEDKEFILKLAKDFIKMRVFDYLRTNGLILDQYYVIFVGGGSILLDSILTELGEDECGEIGIIHDVKANVKGYIAQYQQSKRI